MQLPELTLPDQGLGSIARDGATGDEDERDNEDAGDRDDGIKYKEEPGRASLVFCVRKAAVC